MSGRAPDPRWAITTSTGRPDWQSIRDRLDLAAVATGLLGPAPGRSGARSHRRRWWHCPFHDDRNPSFCVEVGRPTFHCFGCGKGGDAATLVMHVLGCDFPAAVRHLADGLVGIVPRRTKSAAAARTRPAVPDENLPRGEAERLVDDAFDRLWSPEGAEARSYLMGRRGLLENTIRFARLGLVEGPMRLKGGPRGLVIPWHVGGELAMVKLRQPKGCGPKYRQVFIDPDLNVGIFPDPDVVRPGRPLILTEGEFDCLLLGQELEDLEVAVATLGSASARLNAEIRSAIMAASRWIIAADADQAGDKFAEAWPSTAVRCRPQAPGKDWTEMHQSGGNRLRYWWMGWLGIRPEVTYGEDSIIIGPRSAAVTGATL